MKGLETFSLLDPVKKAIQKYSNHPSIIKIKGSMSDGVERFNFKNVELNDVQEVINKLDTKKSSSGTIPVKVIKTFDRDCVKSLKNCLNKCIDDANFPNELKLAEIIPIHKKDDKTNKANYRPISILPALSKVFERVLYNQLNSFFENKLSKFLCGFRRNYSTQHTLFRLLKDWQLCLDNSGVVGTILMDLSKAYDCLPHDLLIAKLVAYGVQEKGLQTYL